MKKFAFLMFCMAFFGFAMAGENVKVQVEGPEDSYNMVRVYNYTTHTDFVVSVYMLQKQDEKFVVESNYGEYKLKEQKDSDTCAGRVLRGQWLGIRLPEDMTDVTVLVTYTDAPLVDIINIELRNGGVEIGQEF